MVAGITHCLKRNAPYARRELRRALGIDDLSNVIERLERSGVLRPTVIEGRARCVLNAHDCHDTAQPILFRESAVGESIVAWVCAAK